jgi:glyoxylase-like metal-dependent hydrolase (beta-lactamase superfamily II)
MRTVTDRLAGTDAPVVALADVASEIAEKDEAKRAQCESASETAWLLGDGELAFVGDLAFNDTHAYLADGHTTAWMAAIDRAEEALAGVRTLYVGHGAPTVPAAHADQRRYPLMAREAVAPAAGGRAELSADEAQGVATLMERYLPGAPLSWLVAAGASAVATELAHDGSAGA